MNEQKFFYTFSLSLLIGSILIFSLHAVIHPDYVSSVHALMILHAAVMYAWYLLLFIQSSLIRSGNPNLHKTLGYWSLVIAVGVIVTGWMVTAHGFRLSKNMLFFSGNILMLTFFTIFYTSAIIYRKNSSVHKRLIIFASISVYIPVAFRIAALFGDRKLAPLVYIAIILIIPIWEMVTARKISKTTICGAVGLIIMVCLTFLLANNSAFTESVRGAFNLVN